MLGGKIIAVIGGCATIASAQVRPHCIVLPDVQGIPTGWTSDTNQTPAVHTQMRTTIDSPTTSGTITGNRVNDYIANQLVTSTSPYLTIYVTYQGIDPSFLTHGSVIDHPPAWPFPVPTQQEDVWVHGETEFADPRIHPWLNEAGGGIDRERTWMNAFIAAYNQTGAPAPRQFIFDNESTLYGFSRNSMTTWGAWTQDHRWNTVDLPGYDATLAELYSTARQQFGTSIFPTNPASALFPGLQYFEGPNRSFNLWLEQVTARVMNAAMEDAWYTPIRTAWPNCKVGNYDYTNSTGQQLFNLPREYVFLNWSQVQHPMFAMHHFSIAPDFPDAGAINEYLPTGIWHSSLKPTTGELITPVLYNAGSLHQQPNVFLPPSAPLRLSSRRTGRHQPASTESH